MALTFNQFGVSAKSVPITRRWALGLFSKRRDCNRPCHDKLRLRPAGRLATKEKRRYMSLIRERASRVFI